MNTQARALQDAYFDWLLKDADQYTHAVTLTLKPKISVMTDKGLYFQTLTTSEAQKNFAHFIKRLNCALFGNAAKRYGKSVTVLPVLEANGQAQLLHYHCAMGQFPDHLPPAAIPQCIANAWHQTPFGHDHVHTQRIRDAGWGEYMGKEIDARNSDVVDLLNLRLPATPQT